MASLPSAGVWAAITTQTALDARGNVTPRSSLNVDPRRSAPAARAGHQYHGWSSAVNTDAAFLRVTTVESCVRRKTTVLLASSSVPILLPVVSSSRRQCINLLLGLVKHEVNAPEELLLAHMQRQQELAPQPAATFGDSSATLPSRTTGAVAAALSRPRVLHG